MTKKHKKSSICNKRNKNSDFLVWYDSEAHRRWFLMYNILIIYSYLFPNTFRRWWEIEGYSHDFLQLHVRFTFIYSSSTDIRNRDVILSGEIYVQRRGPFCKQHTTWFLPKSTFISHSHPNQGGTKRSPSPFTKRQEHTGWWVEHRTLKHIHHSSQH